MTIFVERLRGLRELRGLTGNQVAKRAGINPDTYRGYESVNKNREPNTRTLARIADALNTTSDYLLGLTEQILPLLHNEKNMDPVETQARRELEELFSRKDVLTPGNWELIVDFAKMIAEKERKKKRQLDEK